MFVPGGQGGYSGPSGYGENGPNMNSYNSNNGPMPFNGGNMNENGNGNVDDGIKGSIGGAVEPTRAPYPPNGYGGYGNGNGNRPGYGNNNGYGGNQGFGLIEWPGDTETTSVGRFFRAANALSMADVLGDTKYGFVPFSPRNTVLQRWKVVLASETKKI
ncbi:unnamed protein product [Caenorhabditis sp. 36 PRJEB53466]|nr:unnamed protein product [Caenorhabditis sp. 36 PRJEB53466]